MSRYLCLGRVKKWSSSAGLVFLPWCWAARYITTDIVIQKWKESSVTKENIVLNITESGTGYV